MENTIKRSEDSANDSREGAAKSDNVGGYQNAYRKYISYRRKNRRGELMLKFQREKGCRIYTPAGNPVSSTENHAGSSSDMEKEGLASMSDRFARGPNKELRKWVQGRWCRIHQKEEHWPEGAFSGAPFRSPKPYVPEKRGPPRIPLRKCGCKRVKNNPNPPYLVSLPSGHAASSHRVNYFNKPGAETPMAGGMKFAMRKDDSDTEKTESCYPAFNDMMRMGESDADPDMPAMVNKEDLSPGRRKCDSEEDESDLGEIRDLIETHLIMVGDGRV